jgi:hypothetical protein
MSYARCEETLKEEALDDLPQRIATVESALEKLSCWDDSQNLCREIDKEFEYLQRMIEAVPSKHPRRQEWKSRLEASQATRQGLSERRDSLEADPDHLCSSLHGASERNVSESTKAFAAFTTQQEDEVKLAAAEGRISQVLSQYPVLSVPKHETSIFLNSFGSMREWGEEDDERMEGMEAERLKPLLLELRDSAVNLQDFHRMRNEIVIHQGERIDAAEENVRRGRENTTAAVQLLGGAREHKQAIIFNALAGAILVGGALATGGTVAVGGCVACVVVKGGVTTLSGMGASLLAKKGLQSWQKSAIEWMVKDLPRVIGNLPQESVQMLNAGGDEVERQLVRKLTDTSAWQRKYLTPSFWTKGLIAYYRDSDMNSDASAWMTSFTSPVPALQVFLKIRGMTIAGSLDPDCDVVWCRPVEGGLGTFVRYSIFSSCLQKVVRDFRCVCRAQQVEDAPDGAETYIMASTSLQPELLKDCGLPVDNNGIEHGKIHVAGVMVTARSDGTSLIRIMADVDSRLPVGNMLGAKDTQIRLHVLQTAHNLRKALSEAT